MEYGQEIIIKAGKHTIQRQRSKPQAKAATAKHRSRTQEYGKEMYTVSRHIIGTI